MAGCDCGSDLKFEGLSTGYKRALWMVIAINASMFLVEFSASFIANSRALQADALDFLGDTLTYSLTFLVIGHSLKWRAGAALLKGFTLLLMGLWVFLSTLASIIFATTPDESLMGSVAFSALLANLLSVLLLLRYRDGDANVRSVWLCSRNDAINNLMVIVAAAAVWYSQSHWPDIIAAFFMSGLFLHSAFLILGQAWEEWKSAARVQSCELADKPDGA